MVGNPLAQGWNLFHQMGAGAKGGGVVLVSFDFARRDFPFAGKRHDQPLKL